MIVLDGALACAARGWAVFPCAPETKQPLVKGGLKAASTDPAQLRRWWGQFPAAMIGLPLGGNTGLFALDFDPRIDPETGEVFSLERLKAATEALLGCPLPPSLMQMTPSGGVHLFFRQPADGGAAIRNRGNLPAHVDVRGEGGYVILAPSVRADGRPYRFLRGGGIDSEVAEAPPQLVDLLRSRVRAAASPTRAAGASETVSRYALAALAEECRAVETAASGARNARLNAAAFALGQLVGAGALGESVALAALREAAARNPGRDTPAQLEATIASGFAAGRESPRDLSGLSAPPRRRGAAAPAPSARGEGEPASGLEGGGAGTGLAAEDALNRRCAFLPLTDLGNAERWKLRHGDDFAHVEEWGWLAWDGRRWTRAGAMALLEASVRATVRGIQGEAEWLAASGEDVEVKPADGNRPAKMLSDLLRAHGRSSEGNSRLKAVREIGAGMVPALPGDFDRDPMKFNLLNGTLLFDRVGDGCSDPVISLKPHDREDRITRLAPVDHVPAATCPQWERFLAEVQPDPAVRAFLGAWCGYGLTGDTSEQKFVILHGLGSNGKGVFTGTVGAIMGDYAPTVAIETFLDDGRGKRGSEASPDVARLPGARFVRTQEPPEGRQFAESLVKAITGEGVLAVRMLHRDVFEFRPQFKITVETNPKPKASADAAFWRRVVMVPWDVVIPEERVDRGLAARLIAQEASGILNWMLAGLAQWLAHGLPRADAIVAATAAYREESDPLGRFLAAATIPDERGEVRSARLYTVFRAWALFDGLIGRDDRTWSQVHLTNQLRRRGFRKRTSNGVRWSGIRLVRDEHAFVGPDGAPLETMGPARMEGLGA